MNKSLSQPSQRKCSYCGETFTLVDANLLPFCSRRCKEVDLANWLTESYGLPFEGDVGEEEVELESPRHYFFADEREPWDG